MTTEIKEEIRERISKVIGHDIGPVYPAFFLPADKGQVILERRVTNLKDTGPYVQVFVIGFPKEINPVAAQFVTIKVVAQDFGGVFILN